jgi:hypothetical protein
MFIFLQSFHQTVCVHKAGTKGGQNNVCIYSDCYSRERERDKRRKELTSVSLNRSPNVRVYWSGAADLQGPPMTEAAQGREREGRRPAAH